jgi:hypothetical protein
MRNLFRLRLIAFALLAVAAVARLQSQGGLGRVGDLSIELKASRPAVLVQESLKVTTRLTNRGSAVITAPAADGPSPFVYELRPTQGNQSVRVVSAKLAREATSRGTPQPDPPLPFNVGPGGSVPRQDDLAAMAVTPLAPAVYAVTVSTSNPFPIGPSAPAQVQVAPPRVIVTAATVEPNYDRRVAFANAEQDGAFAILALQSNAKSQESAVFFRANTQDRLLKPESIAVSVPTGIDVQTRWVAWTSGGMLFATKDFDVPSARTVVLRAALPGIKGQVLSPGYFFADDSGLFLVLDGAALHAFRMSNAALTLAWSADIGASNLERVRIRYAGSAKGDGVLQLLGIANRDGRHQLLLQSWNVRDGRKVVSSSAIAEFQLPVVAWFLPVVGKGRSDQLQVISGPAQDGRFGCGTFALEKKTSQVPAQPIAPVGAPAEEWAVTIAGNGKVVVATRTTAGRLLSLAMPGAAWRTVADKVSAGHLDAYADYDHAWVEWSDPEFGFRRAAVNAE